MNRKETLGRLLLTLLTAFVMVAGAFVTAIPTLTVEENAPGVVDVRELDEETRVIGEAPISANTEIQGQSLIETTNEEIVSNDPDPMIEVNSATTRPAQEAKANTIFSEPDRGTRSATVEAYGPYGTQSDPKYEGEIINFDSDVVGGINDDYRFRWEVTGDGIWDGPGAGNGWGAWGETAYDHTYLDNNVGTATVQAWDGTWTTTNYYTSMWQYDTTMTCNVGGYYLYTYGNQFTVLDHDITVDRLGGFRTSYWAYPYPQMPYYIENIRLWTTGGAMLGQTGALYPADDSWAWGDIPDVTLTAGQSYIVAWHCAPESMSYPYYYPHIGTYMTDVPDNDEVSWDGYRYRYGSDVFPTYGPYSYYAWFCDIDYYWEVTVENTIEDSADVWVDNVAPIVINPQAVPSVGQEGYDVGFTGSFMDPGLDDDWEYRWDFGDGTFSPWFSVNKYSGGARVLFLHCMGAGPSYGFEDLEEGLLDMGPFITQLDSWDYGPTGENTVPDLDYLLQYDVIVVGTNFYNNNNDEVGDRLADFSDVKGLQGSGGVIIMAFGHYGADPGVQGRWVEDDYDPMDQAYSLYFGTTAMGPVYLPSHPIMDGVSTLSAYYKIGTFSVPRGDYIAAYTNGVALAAAYENPTGSGARHASLNFLPSVTVPTGDWIRMVHNAIRWTSRQPDPEPLPQPIATELIYHTYVDDHPTHVTPEDTFDVKLEVRDDDHMRLIQTGAETTIMTEDFSGFSVPPAGWTKDPWTTNWRLYYGNLAGGTYPEAQFYWYPYTTGTYRLYSYGFSSAGFTSLTVRFKHYINHFSGPYNLWVETSADGVNWDVAWEMANPGSLPATDEEFSTTLNVGGTTYISWTFDGNPFNINWWNVDDIEIVSFPTHQMEGLGTAGTTVTIANVFPGAMVPDTFEPVVNERVTIDFAGFELTDPAIQQRTEEFWYRWDYGDGTPVGPWIWKGTIAPPDFSVLVLNSFGVGEDCVQVLEDELGALGFGPYLTVDEYNFGPQGSNSIPSLAYMMNYDVILVSMNYYIFNTGMVNDLGNKLADYSDAGGGVIQMTFAGGVSYYSHVAGRWMAEGYNPVSYAGNHYGYVSMGDVYDPGHPIMEEVEDMQAYYKHGTSGITSGATRLADYSNGFTLCAYTDLDHHAPGGGRIIGLNFFPWFPYVDGDGARMMANAAIWAWGEQLPTPVLDTVSHDYGDNGIYTAGLQIIDDDMMWDWAPGDMQPTFTGMGDPNDWISFVYFPVEVLNVDPTIWPRIRAYVNMDLVIRTTGEPKNDCTMTLWLGTTALGSVTVHHDGNYKMETLPATLDMGSINDYYVTVEYENADPDGANPTWVFEGRFPSGHTKELKRIFKEDGTMWTIGADLLKTMLIGEDIVFTAVGADDGSDDLGFVWQFGDGALGAHVYANADSTMVEGVSTQPEDIFNAHPNRDPWFDRTPNTVRSPDMNPIVIMDEITHAYEDGDYYYVTCILMDDDVCDGYPSYQTFLNGGGYDIEFYECDLS
jgi:hypothetical protein